MFRAQIRHFIFVCPVILAICFGRHSTCAADTLPTTDGFIGISGTRFVLNGKVFPVAGVNNHYLPYGSSNEVRRILDDAVAMHANVVRTFIQPIIGSRDGSSVPTIWNWKSTADSSNLNVNGAYMAYWDTDKDRMAFNDGPTGLQRIDFLFDEARKRNLKLIVAFLDFWPYTGGAQQMRAWYGSDDIYSFFAKDPRTVNDYKAWVKHVLTRTNSINGIKYIDDPTVFAWELMNEPDIHPEGLLRSWMNEMAVFVKAIDPRHLLASGHANATGKFDDLKIKDIDFGTWHAYPRFNKLSPAGLNKRIPEFCKIGATYNKPVLLEEFGLSRSNEGQVGIYEMWLNTIFNTQDCAGWVVWRLVSRQDSGDFPEDKIDGFDVRNDGGPLWVTLSGAALRERSKR
jgi:mannan endo-1,4-beta-mannosidase